MLVAVVAQGHQVCPRLGGLIVFLPSPGEPHLQQCCCRPWPALCRPCYFARHSLSTAVAAAAVASSGRVEISAQNHNFAVDPATLPEGVEVTHINLNDGTCAGMVYPAKKAMTIQVGGKQHRTGGA